MIELIINIERRDVRVECEAHELSYIISEVKRILQEHDNPSKPYAPDDDDIPF